MKTNRALIVLGVIVVAVVRGPAYGAWTWTTLDYPGAATTCASGVDGNTIVGSYTDSSGTRHGFAYDGSNWRSLDYPGAVSTGVSAVSGNKMVGYYYDSASDIHGFLYDGTSWSEINYPGAISTVPRGISDDRIVGTYDTGPSNSYGFVLDRSNASEFAFSTHSVYIYGISGDKMVGESGAIYDGTTWTHVAPPSWDLIGSGQIFGVSFLGICNDNVVGQAVWSYYPYWDMRILSFLYDGHTWKTLSFPIASRTTQVYGISGNTIVGGYDSHAFLLTIPEPASLMCLGMGCISLNSPTE